MDEEAQDQPQISRKEQTGCLGQFGWFASGSVLPLVSLTFYRKAARRKVGLALLFFLVFTLLITILATISLGNSMADVTQDIRQSFEEGSFPEIIIEDGIAKVDAPMPLILIDENTGSEIMLFAIDTTGQLNEIDRYRYSQGILLKRTELHLWNNARYQVLPLSELHSTFDKNPIIINADTVTSAWNLFTVGFSLVAFVSLVLWETVARLMFIALYALVMWGIVSLIRPNTGFDVVIISALYALVPAIYLTRLFSRIGLGFPGLQTFLLLPFWIAALFAVLSESKFFSQEYPLRLWTAALGIPMLVLFSVDLVVKLPSPYGPASLWATTLLTVLVLVGLRLYFRYKDREITEPTQG